MAEPEMQYASAAHQADTAMAGMWLFLASEALFFGGLAYVWLALHRMHPGGMALATGHTNLAIGTANTALLLTSSLAMTIGVERARTGRGRAVMWACAATAALGLAFLALKGWEWRLDFEKHLFPGAGFGLTGPDRGGAALFFSLYFVATGLHSVHMLAGIGLVSWAGWRARQGQMGTPLEAVGLYWSFVDLVWVMLYPLLYLVGRA